MMGKNKENRAHIENKNGNLYFIIVDVLTIFNVTWFYRSKSFFKYPILAIFLYIEATFQLFFNLYYNDWYSETSVGTV